MSPHRARACRRTSGSLFLFFASKTIKNLRKTNDFCIRSPCLPLPASACLRMAPRAVSGLLLACPRPAPGLPLAFNRLPSRTCEAQDRMRKDRGRRCTPHGVFDPPGRSRPHTACQTSPDFDAIEFLQSRDSIYRVSYSRSSHRSSYLSFSFWFYRHRPAQTSLNASPADPPNLRRAAVRNAPGS